MFFNLKYASLRVNYYINKIQPFKITGEKNGTE